MIDPQRAGVSEAEWRAHVESCHELTVAKVIEETYVSRSIILEIPPALEDTFRYKAGQFLSFKIPYEGHVLVRSYSLASSPDTDTVHKVTVKRVDDGRISNLFNDTLKPGDPLMVVPPAGFFVLKEQTRPIVLFAGGSGITPVIAIIKSALATTQRALKLVYANRDRRSIIFDAELNELASSHPGRLEITHSLDDTDGFLTAERAMALVGAERHADFYLCGPSVFMDVVEGALHDRDIDRSMIHIERFISPPDHFDDVKTPDAGAPAETGESPSAVTVAVDGNTTEVAYESGESILVAARRAGLDPPFSCEEGYCSCCMAKLVSGEVKMEVNDCLTEDLLEEGWVLTCQARCVSGPVKVEYPD